jgi:L-ascorbate metabolism protein UlaG (beta-lactamase superfamily)
MKKNRYTSKKVRLYNLLRWRFDVLFSKKGADDCKKMTVIKESVAPQPNVALWLGHATLWANMNGINIIIDPLFDNIPFYKRHTELPISKKKIRADIVLITHSHYDHFDMPSIKFLIKQNPNLTIVAPKGFRRYFKKYKNLIELDWWEAYRIKDVIITFVPSLHWSNRYLLDKNRTLWGGFVVNNDQCSFYHSGDTAYGEQFAEIGKRFKISDAFLPIGAYKPEYIMRHNHLDPQEALAACADLGVQRFIPVHYGTFKLSDESLCEPLEWLEKLLQEQKYPFATLPFAIGEAIYLSKISTLKST